METLTAAAVKHIAQLANLPLTDGELQKLAPELSAIVKFISKLSQLNTKNVLPTWQTTGQVNVLREDEIDTSRMLTQEQALVNARNKYKGFFQVPQIFDL